MKSILVIDDDRAVLNLLSIRLRGLYRTFATSDPTEAIALVREHKPDLVLCDMDMPKMNGAEVAAALKAQGFGAIPVVYLTGLVTRSEAQSMPGKGAERMLAKQAPVSELLACIKSLIGE